MSNHIRSYFQPSSFFEFKIIQGLDNGDNNNLFCVELIAENEDPAYSKRIKQYEFQSLKHAEFFIQRLNSQVNEFICIEDIAADINR